MYSTYNYAKKLLYDTCSSDFAILANISWHCLLKFSAIKVGQKIANTVSFPAPMQSPADGNSFVCSLRTVTLDFNNSTVNSYRVSSVWRVVRCRGQDDLWADWLGQLGRVSSYTAFRLQLQYTVSNKLYSSYRQLRETETNPDLCVREFW